jgi:hypothetical protein
MNGLGYLLACCGDRLNINDKVVHSWWYIPLRLTKRVEHGGEVHSRLMSGLCDCILFDVWGHEFLRALVVDHVGDVAERIGYLDLRDRV